MVLYRSNDALMCKILATTLQGEAQDWFHTLPPRSIRSFDDLSLVFTNKYSSYYSIKKKSDHLFNVKKNPKKSHRHYVKKFKVEKVKIVGYDDSIASATFQKGFLADHPLFGELISELWLKLPKQSKGDTSKLDHTKYCIFHRGLEHTTNDYYTWKNYLEKLVKEGKVDRYLDKPIAQPKKNADADEEEEDAAGFTSLAESERFGLTTSSLNLSI
ncbi:uncharacterized protein [Pyrus communis]|uniref:uncharacterized protein n=1 Tax=Pyrus communis TaxID=23211 RepID=UPI0035C0595E